MGLTGSIGIDDIIKGGIHREKWDMHMEQYTVSDLGNLRGQYDFIPVDLSFDNG